MRAFIRFVLLALVLLVVALVSALTAMRFAIHGREVAVPSLIDKTPAEARRLAEESGFELTIERQYYSSEVAEGRILSQIPMPYTLVRRGWEIRVAQSLGAQRVQIPNVVGQSERAAELNIRRRGLDVNAIANLTVPEGPQGQVLAQSPPANASGISAPKISLLLAQPPSTHAFVMPNFVGQNVGSARLLLQTAGLRMGMVAGQPGSAAAANGIISSQTPAPGQKVPVGTPVNFEVRQ